MIKCEKCGEKIDCLMVDVFNRDGSDALYVHDAFECTENAVCVDVSPNWTGYELSEEEMLETIECPYCGDFPFKSKEIQTIEFVRIVMFQEAADEH